MSSIFNQYSMHAVPSYSWLHHRNHLVNSSEHTLRSLVLSTVDPTQRGVYFKRYVECFECLSPYQIYELIVFNRQESLLWKEVLSSISSVKLRELLGSLLIKFIDLFGFTAEDFEGYFKDGNRTYFDQLSEQITKFHLGVISAEKKIGTAGFLEHLQDTSALQALEADFENWRNSASFQAAFRVFQTLDALKNIKGLLNEVEMAVIEHLFNKCAPSTHLSMDLLLRVAALKLFMPPFVRLSVQMFKNFPTLTLTEKAKVADRLVAFKQSDFVRRYLLPTEVEAFDIFYRNVLTDLLSVLSKHSRVYQSIAHQPVDSGVDLEYLKGRFAQFDPTFSRK